VLGAAAACPRRGWGRLVHFVLTRSRWGRSHRSHRSRSVHVSGGACTCCRVKDRGGVIYLWYDVAVA
jgi:hypothetical protein